MTSVEERFWQKVDKNGPGGCWLWTASLNVEHKYGQFRMGGQMRRAHIVAYEFVIGPVPNGLELDHTCNVRHCVNPEHLEPVTHAENCRRSGKIGRSPGSRGNATGAHRSPTWNGAKKK